MNSSNQLRNLSVSAVRVISVMMLLVLPACGDLKEGDSEQGGSQIVLQFAHSTTGDPVTWST